MDDLEDLKNNANRLRADIVNKEELLTEADRRGDDNEKRGLQAQIDGLRSRLRDFESDIARLGG